MGLSHYPSAAEGMLPLIVINTLITVNLIKSVVRAMLQLMGCVENHQDLEEYARNEEEDSDNTMRERRISVTMFKSMCNESSGITRTGSGSGCCPMECCVCLHRFEADEEVSELSCKHFFHKGCLEKWLDHKRSTCPLCRSTL